MSTTKIVRRRGLTEMTGLSLATLYRMIKRGEFPAPIQLSTQAVGWHLKDVMFWIESRRRAMQ